MKIFGEEVRPVELADFGPLDTIAECDKARAMLGPERQRLHQIQMQFQSIRARAPLTTGEEALWEFLMTAIRRVEDIRAFIRTRKNELATDRQARFAASLMNAVKDMLTPEMAKAVIDRAHEIAEQHAARRAVVATSTGSALEPRATTGGMRQRKAADA